MQAVMYKEYGSPDVLHVKEIAKPTPREGEVLVKVQAVSVNRSDWEGLLGTPLYARFGGVFKPGRPILGSDIAGVVESAGRSGGQFRPGDAVFGDILPRMGGFAEYVCAREHDLVPIPAGMPFETAAAIPQAGVIALQGIRDKGKVQPGQTVLVNGGGGGAGMFALQLAKLAGAEVTGVDSAGKLDFMCALGADHVIDYAAEDFTKSGKQYDLVLDVIAHRSAYDYERALNPGGSYYCVGGAVAALFQILVLGPWIQRTKNKKLRILAVQPNQQDLAYVAELCAAGKVTPIIDRRYPLHEVPAALQYLGEGRSKGKVVITL